MLMASISEVYLLFAALLEYPTPGLAKQAEKCAGILAPDCPGGAEMMAGFRDYVDVTPLQQLEELYTLTFDLQAACYPHVGHHLFGESYKRSWFMARLNQSYREKGFALGAELPDHVSVILRFLAGGYEDEFSQVLQNEGLKPAVEKMLALFEENSGNPYRQVLGGLALVLQEISMMSSMNSISLTKDGGMGND